MAITKTQSPYEFLVRWTDGKISGAHIKFLERIIDDDGVTVLSEKEGMAQPVSMAGEVGYPIADIWAAITVSSVAAGQQALIDIADAQIKRADADAAKSAADTAKAEADTALAAQATSEKALADKATFDAAVAAAVAQAAP